MLVFISVALVFSHFCAHLEYVSLSRFLLQMCDNESHYFFPHLHFCILQILKFPIFILYTFSQSQSSGAISEVNSDDEPTWIKQMIKIRKRKQTKREILPVMNMTARYILKYSSLIALD